MEQTRAHPGKAERALDDPAAPEAAAKGATATTGHGPRVATSPTRCPFCHEGCSPDAADVLVCRDCLSRHHAACWREGEHRCASCGGRRPLEGTAPKPSPRERALVRRGLADEAAANMARRVGISDAEARAALLDAAARELSEASRLPLPPWAIVIIVLGSLPFVVAIFGLIFR